MRNNQINQWMNKPEVLKAFLYFGLVSILITTINTIIQWINYNPLNNEFGYYIEWIIQVIGKIGVGITLVVLFYNRYSWRRKLIGLLIFICLLFLTSLDGLLGFTGVLWNLKEGLILNRRVIVVIESIAGLLFIIFFFQGFLFFKKENLSPMKQLSLAWLILKLLIVIIPVPLTMIIRSLGVIDYPEWIGIGTSLFFSLQYLLFFYWFIIELKSEKNFLEEKMDSEIQSELGHADF